MKTSVIGYPRIGVQRELKFAEEKYFRNEITEEEFNRTAKQIRISSFEVQKKNKTDFIPSNDFSYYDGMLDTAFLLNVIPKRYSNLNLSELDTYFAMARGYQGISGDVRALAMKKWFNTNYHYMVPELDDDTDIRLHGNKPFKLFSEALEIGIKTKPVITGAYTFIDLSKYIGNKDKWDFSERIANVYIEIINKLSNLGAEWIQFDEPCLVKDMTENDKKHFINLYKKILSGKGKTKIILQTYFGDVRDCYDDICSMDFDGIGLDFIEGSNNLESVMTKGFPKNKILFAGVVNGKNIWKNKYCHTLDIISKLQEVCEELAIGTSCSLLHVPYTLKNEIKLSEKYKIHFAFAEEKLSELAELKTILLSSDPTATEEYIHNSMLFKKNRVEEDIKVKKRISSLTDKDFIRLPEFFEREKIQKNVFKLPILPTTTIGSFPQTKEIRQLRASFRNGEVTEEEYDKIIKQKIAECVNLQEKIGLDVLVHGEFERNDMVEYFGECLNGYIFTEKAWVQSYGTRCVKPPIVWGDISRSKPITVKWSSYARTLTKKPLKGMLTGPVTILNWSFPREDISLEESAFQIALAIRDEVLDLERNGIYMIQVDEAALREKLPLRKSDRKSYLDWAIKAFRLVHSGVKPETQIHTHMCYSEFSDIIKEIDDMDADVITFEASRSDLSIIDVLKENNFRTETGPGVYDIHSPRVPSTEEIKASLQKMLSGISAEKLWVNPDCGLKTRSNSEVVPSLKNLVEAAKILREEINA